MDSISHDPSIAVERLDWQAQIVHHIIPLDTLQWTALNYFRESRFQMGPETKERLEASLEKYQFLGLDNIRCFGTGKS